MNTTDIYDILLTLLNNKNMKLMTHLGVTDIPTGKEKLLTLDAGQVRDFYDFCRPTPKPRKADKLQDLLLRVWTIREAGCIRNAVREKLQRTPSAKALHMWHIPHGLDMTYLYAFTIRGIAPFYLPPSYNKFFTKKDGSIAPRTKDSVIRTMRRYIEMMKNRPAITHENPWGRLISIYYRKKSPADRWSNSVKMTYQDNGIYGLLELMYKHKLFNKNPSLSWHFGLA